MLTILFNLLSVFYVFRSIQIAWQVWQNRDELQGHTFTSQQKNLAGQASFFLAVPVGVFIHESGHALAIWLFRGQVVEFGYRVFWGFVRPAGNFSLEQDWFISLAGTLGSLIFGLFCWFILRNHSSPSVRYFGLRAFHYQIFFSLIYYPIFTLMGFYGDWATIYDFNATPVLSGATAVIHAGLLLLFWQAERNGFFEMGDYSTPELRGKLAELEARTAAAPNNSELQLQLIEAYRQGNMFRKARQQTQKLLEANPRSADGYLQLALLDSEGKRETPARARDHAAKAISLGLHRPQAVAVAHQIIGRYNLDRNNAAEAIDHFNQAIGAVAAVEEDRSLPNLLYWRALAHRRKAQYEAAYQDIQQAIQLARQNEQTEAVPFLKKELEVIQHHAGRSFGET